MATEFRRLAIVVFICSGSVANLVAQSGSPASFRNLATSDDGAALYFSSALPLAGSTPGTYKIFEFSAGGLRVIAQQARLDGFFWTNNYDLGWPSVSGDGSVVTYTGEAYCTGPQSRCAFSEIYFDGRFLGNVISGDGTVMLSAPGQVRLSRNARFALFVGISSDITRTDLFISSTTTIRAVQSRPSELRSHVAAGRSIASDGTAVLVGTKTVAEPTCCTSQPEIQVLGHDTVQLFLAQDEPTSAVIDDSATTVAYETHVRQPDQSLGPGRIVLLDLSSASEVVVAENAKQPSLTNDGGMLLYIGPDTNGVTQAWVLSRPDPSARQLTNDSTGIVEAVISGDGSTAFVITNSMSILQVDVASGFVEDVTSAITTSNSSGSGAHSM